MYPFGTRVHGVPGPSSWLRDPPRTRRASTPDLATARKGVLRSGVTQPEATLETGTSPGRPQPRSLPPAGRGPRQRALGRNFPLPNRPGPQTRRRYVAGRLRGTHRGERRGECVYRRAGHHIPEPDLERPPERQPAAREPFVVPFRSCRQREVGDRIRGKRSRRASTASWPRGISIVSWSPGGKAAPPLAPRADASSCYLGSHDLLLEASRWQSSRRWRARGPPARVTSSCPAPSAGICC